MHFFHVLAIAIAAHTTYVCLRSGLFAESYRLAATIRPRHIVANLPALFATGVAAWLLLQVPGLDVGWTDLVGGTGNILLAQQSDDSTSVLTIVVVLVVAACMPVLARIEEQLFRAGSERRSRRHRLGVAVGFGVAHSIAGIPLGSALALTIAGLWFTNRYLEGYRQAGEGGLGQSVRRDAALDAATVAHLAWNWTLVLLLAVAMFG